MNPDLNGRAATISRERPWVILATDRHQTGQAIRAVSEGCGHLLAETANSRFARFATAREAERWLADHRARLDDLAYRYTITTL